jgi:hypothetical protein
MKTKNLAGQGLGRQMDAMTHLLQFAMEDRWNSLILFGGMFASVNP